MKFSAGKKMLAVIGSVAAVAALGACSAQPGTAVSIGDVAYSEAELDQGVAQISVLLGREISRTELVYGLPQFAHINTIGDERGLGIDEANVSTELGALLAAGRITAIPENPGRIVEDFVNASAVARDLGADIEPLLAEAQATMPVSVNPRYGQFDELSGQFQRVPLGDVLPIQFLGALTQTAQ
ncbi:hypothetical protein [Schaalia suimastitidis]|uniref:hypothetical protein n=1 Tax=Schaalia suimastitidis TaxID=121163 RepID=UPI0003FEC1AE|nr:hypothetical protein [Schaalia suimastitidis]